MMDNALFDDCMTNPAAFILRRISWRSGLSSLRLAVGQKEATDDNTHNYSALLGAIGRLHGNRFPFPLAIFHGVLLQEECLLLIIILPSSTIVTWFNVHFQLWRHGDRSPSSTFPTDKGNDESTWPQGWGELTQEGMRQHYALGKLLRERYKSFLSKRYSQYEVRLPYWPLFFVNTL